MVRTINNFRILLSKRSSFVFIVKYLIILILYFVLFKVIIFDRIIANENLQTGTLIVEVAGLENDDGHVFTHLYDNLEYFPITCKNAFRKLVGKPSNGRCEFIYKEIPFGTYAMTTHHDENGNGLMDKNWIGLPKEGYGFSNDVNPLFSLPKFEKARFVLKEKILKIVIHMQY